MTGTIKRRVMSLLMALAVLVSAFAVFQSVSLKAQAAQTLTQEQINKAVAWAVDLANNKATSWNTRGKNGWYSVENIDSEGGNCANFVASAFYSNNTDLPYQVVNGSGWYQKNYNVRKTTPPPKGAIVLYSGGSWGHLALSLGDGRVVQGGLSPCVRITDYAKPASNLTYVGWTTYCNMEMAAYEQDSTVPTIPAPKTQAEVESRLANIKSGQYGVNKTFPYSSTPVPASLAGEAGGTRTDGYARYVFFNTFGIPMSPGVKGNQYQLSNSNGNLKVIASCSGTSTAATMKADVFKTKPGDIIQGKGSGFYQTMIVLSYNENGITVLDCDNDYKCGILERTRDWSRFSGSFKQYTIYRSVNYPTSAPPAPVTPEPPEVVTPEPPEVVTPEPSVKLKWDINGDGKTNVTDVIIFMGRVLSGTISDLKEYDFNDDGVIDVNDVQALISYILS